MQVPQPPMPCHGLPARRTCDPGREGGRKGTTEDGKGKGKRPRRQAHYPGRVAQSGGRTHASWTRSQSGKMGRVANMYAYPDQCCRGSRKRPYGDLGWSVRSNNVWWPCFDRPPTWTKEFNEKESWGWAVTRIGTGRRVSVRAEQESQSRKPRKRKTKEPQQNPNGPEDITKQRSERRNPFFLLLLFLPVGRLYSGSPMAAILAYFCGANNTSCRPSRDFLAPFVSFTDYLRQPDPDQLGLDPAKSKPGFGQR